MTRSKAPSTCCWSPPTIPPPTPSPCTAPPSTRRSRPARAAALILAADRSFDGPITITAPDAVTFDDIAQIASTLTGRTIERVVVDDEQWIAGQVAAGSPEATARMLLTLFQAARQGRFAGVDPLLTELLGRAPRSVTDLLTDRITGQGHSR